MYADNIGMPALSSNRVAKKSASGESGIDWQMKRSDVGLSTKGPEGVTGVENTSRSTQGEVTGLEITLISAPYLTTRKKKRFVTFV